jgi:hypothetical protein
MPRPEDDEKVYVELARRLCAAYLSFQMTNKSVDYTLKRYVKRNPGRFWFQLARHVAETVPQCHCKQAATKTGRRFS